MMPAPATADHSGPGIPAAAVQRLLASLTALGLLILTGWLLLRREPLADHDWSPPATIAFSLDINTASAAELAQLPGIGPTMAKRIIAHRRQHGPFSSSAAIADVSGIGPVTLGQIRRFIRPIPPPEPKAR